METFQSKFKKMQESINKWSETRKNFTNIVDQANKVFDKKEELNPQQVAVLATNRENVY